MLNLACYRDDDADTATCGKCKFTPLNPPKVTNLHGHPFERQANVGLSAVCQRSQVNPQIRHLAIYKDYFAVLSFFT